MLILNQLFNSLPLKTISHLAGAKVKDFLIQVKYFLKKYSLK